MTDFQKRDNSLISTHMTKNQSTGSGGFFDAEMRKQAILEYANQPIPK